MRAGLRACVHACVCAFVRALFVGKALVLRRNFLFVDARVPLEQVSLVALAGKTCLRIQQPSCAHALKCS